MPLRALHEAQQLDPEESVAAYAIWGGVPRNWELAAEYDSTGEAVAALILDRNGVLPEHPRHALEPCLTLVGQRHRRRPAGSPISAPWTGAPARRREMLDAASMRL